MAYTAVDDSEAYFQAKLYTGNDSTQSITFDGSTDMQPDLIWIKSRTNGASHIVTDAVRGVNSQIYMEGNWAAGSYTNDVTAFGSDGWTMGLDAQVNGAQNYVGWCWKESATSGFDIVAYTGNGSARTISHALSAVPNFIIIKNLDAADGWHVYHSGNTSAPETDYLRLDTSAASVDQADIWNDTAPTSSVFNLGDADVINTNTEDYIAYVFAAKQGFSKFGTYVGDGNAGNLGPFLYTGFKPAFVITKPSSEADAWTIWDNKRPGYNDQLGQLFCHASSLESAGSANKAIAFCSNGFKINAADANELNKDGDTFIYMAFAEAPLVNSKGAPANASV